MSLPHDRHRFDSYSAGLEVLGLTPWSIPDIFVTMLTRTVCVLPLAFRIKNSLYILSFSYA